MKRRSYIKTFRTKTIFTGAAQQKLVSFSNPNMNGTVQGADSGDSQYTGLYIVAFSQEFCLRITVLWKRGKGGGLKLTITPFLLTILQQFYDLMVLRGNDLVGVE